MPTYAFRCPACGEFDAAFPMAAVPARMDCHACGAAARRIFSSPHLGAGASTVMKLLDTTKRTAREPAVVESVPGRRKSPRPVSHNPLHARLPAP
jgi:putative FmdB family regulatory protein